MGASAAEIQEESVNRFPPIGVDRLAPRESSDFTRFLFFSWKESSHIPRSRLRSRFNVSFVRFNTHPKQRVWVWRPKGARANTQHNAIALRTRNTRNSCTWEAHGGQKRCRWRGGRRSEVKYSTVRFLRVSKFTAPDDDVAITLIARQPWIWGWGWGRTELL